MVIEEEAREFEEFSSDCPKRHWDRDRSCSFCYHLNCTCTSRDCVQFHSYKMVLKKLASVLRELKRHCHYHGYSGQLNSASKEQTRKVTFG